MLDLQTNDEDMNVKDDDLYDENAKKSTFLTKIEKDFKNLLENPSDESIHKILDFSKKLIKS